MRRLPLERLRIIYYYPKFGPHYNLVSSFANHGSQETISISPEIIFIYFFTKNYKQKKKSCFLLKIANSNHSNIVGLLLIIFEGNTTLRVNRGLSYQYDCGNKSLHRV